MIAPSSRTDIGDAFQRLRSTNASALFFGHHGRSKVPHQVWRVSSAAQKHSFPRAKSARENRRSKNFLSTNQCIANVRSALTSSTSREKIARIASSQRSIMRRHHQYSPAENLRGDAWARRRSCARGDAFKPRSQAPFFSCARARGADLRSAFLS